jgi:hypothetical protein
MRDNSIIIFALIIIILATVLGGPLGLGFHGTMDKPKVDSGHSPGLFEVISWCWNGLSFLFGMIVFQVDGIPTWLAMIYDVIALLLLWVILKWVRGTTSGV